MSPKDELHESFALLTKILCALNQDASRFRQSNKSFVFLARSTCRHRDFSWIYYYPNSFYHLIKRTLLVVNFMC